MAAPPNDPQLQELLAAVREACSADMWSKAVELTRAPGIWGESESPTEVVIRVALERGLLGATVTLWLEDCEWSCDCLESGAVCVHAAAAVIALRRARSSGQTLPGGNRSAWKLRYCFSRTPRGLTFDRAATLGGKSLPITSSLSAFQESRPSSETLLAQSSDVLVDAAAGGWLSGLVPTYAADALLMALQNCDDVTLDSKKVATSGAVAPFEARVQSCAEGFRIHVEANQAIHEVFDNRIARCGNVLRALGQCELTARELQEYRVGKVFSHAQVAELLADIIPSLSDRLPVQIDAPDLPRLVHGILPRVQLECTADGDDIGVLAAIVYGDPPIARVDGERLWHLQGDVPARAREHEQRLIEKLGGLGVIPGRRVRMQGAAAPMWLQKIGNALGDDALVATSKQQFRIGAEITPIIRLTGTSLDVTFESIGQADGTKRRSIASADAVLKAWARGEPLVRLLDGGWAPLCESWLRSHASAVATMLEAAQLSRDGRVPACLHPELSRLCGELGLPVPSECRAIAELHPDFLEYARTEVPPDLFGRLRSYQRQGAGWLIYLRRAGLGALLADDMGLGKTVQAISALRGRSLVVCPTSVLHNWVDEIARFRPELSCSLYHGPGRKIDPGSSVTLTSYALMRLDCDELREISWDCVVLDEAQAIKNPDSQVAQAAYSLRADFRAVLTGTPIENKLGELWSLMHFLNRGLLGGRSGFDARWARASAGDSNSAMMNLRERTSPFVLRRRKAEVEPDLPARTDMVVRCELSEEERQVYDVVRAATVPQLVEQLSGGLNVMMALEALLRLRQACCHTALVPGQPHCQSSKLATLVERLLVAIDDGHKSLVFSQWTSLLDLLEPELTEAGISYCRLDGSTKDRRGVVGEFQSPSGPQVMIVSLRAGGTGLNLTAADHVFLLDPWWNPAVENQAADRAHRIGQTHPVFVHRLVAENTIEERILELQESKLALGQAVLGDGTEALAFNSADLAALLTRESRLD